MEQSLKALALHREKIMSLHNVVGVGVGHKEVGGQSTGQPSVIVLVRRKLPSSELPSTQIVPRRLSRSHTDVVEVGNISLLGRTQRMRPAQPGTSIGHFLVTAGTFGALVRDRRDGQPLILSNNHVLANLSNGRDGRASPGDPVYQPGRYDGGTAQDVIAYLERFVPIYPASETPSCPVAQGVQRAANLALAKLAPAYRLELYRAANERNEVDAAVARPVSPDDVLGDILEVGSIKGQARPIVGMAVKKSGRTTGLTQGKIRVVEASLRISIGDIGEAVFFGQAVTSPLAEPGDSGSLVLDEGNRAVGLLSAGSDQASIFAPIERVMSLLDVTL